MSIGELKRLIKNDDRDGLVNFLNKKNLQDKGYSDFCPEYEDYYILQDLLKNGNKSMAQMCIDAGFRVFVPNIDMGLGSLTHLAVMLGCPLIVQSLMDRQVPLHLKNCNQETPLILAALCGNNQITNMILSHIQSKNYSNNEDFSHFHIACMQNHVEKVKSLMIFGTDINQQIKQDSLYNPGFTALHFAVQTRSFETVELLVNSGADVTIQDKRGLTPLHLAFRIRNKQMIDSLLSVQCFFAKNPTDPTNLSHFHIACAMNNVEVVKDFVEKQLKVDHEIPSKTHNWSNYDAFMFAVTHESIDVVKYLMKVNCLINCDRVSNLLAYVQGQNNKEIIRLVKSEVEGHIAKAECNKSFARLVSRNYPRAITKLNIDHCPLTKYFKRLELSQYTQLHLSVIEGNQTKTMSILKVSDHSIVLTQDVRGKTPIHLTFEKNKKKILNPMLLCHLKLTENPYDANGLSHFHISCTLNNPTIAKDFIQKGVNINVAVNADSPVFAGWTPLHFAIASESLDVVELLLANGADYTIENAAGSSSFDAAIPTDTQFLFRNSSDGEFEWQFAEEILLAHEQWKRENFNGRGVTFLHIASATEDVETVKRLASTDSLNKIIDVEVKMWGGYTPLHLAAHYGNREVMSILLDYKADTSIQSSRRHTAANCIFDNSDVDERILLSSKNVRNDDGVSQFQLACRMKNVAAVRHFLKLGVDVNEPVPLGCDITDAGKTPLHFAVSGHAVEVVRLLLENGADVHARDCNLNTPLHECGNLAVLKLLLEYGADVHARNCDLRSALASTLQWCKGNADFVNALFECGLDVDEEDRSGVCMFRYIDLSRPALLLVVKHVRRLLVLRFGINGNMMKYFNDMKAKLFTLYRDLEFETKCREELGRMKEVRVDERTTLYDLLLKDTIRMMAYCKNETVKQIMQLEADLKKKFPIYSYLLILQFKRGLERTRLQREGEKSLSTLMNLSNNCVLHHILQFFNNRVLMYLNLAAKIWVKKIGNIWDKLQNSEKE